MQKLFTTFFSFLFLAKLHGQDMDRQFQTILEDRQLMGLSAVVVCNDTVVYAGNFGMADFARNIPVSDSTLFRVASISKTITATAFMMLYEKGFFSLDEDISNILGYKVRNPYFINVSITPRMLLSHTSSMQDGTGSWNFIMNTYNNHTPPLQRLLIDTGSYYTCDIWQEHPPGTFFNYCNMNFGIIATLIEKLSGKRFDVFCKENIFDPMKIKDGYNLQAVACINNIAVLYRATKGVWTAQSDNFLGIMPPPRELSHYIPGTNGFVFGPYGGLRISAADLAKILMRHINGGVYKGVIILQDSTVAIMYTPQWKFNGSNGDTYYGLFQSWGLGFQLAGNAGKADWVAPGFPMAGHIGEAYGFISDMFFNDSLGFGMIFMTNGCKTDFDYGTHSAFFALDEDAFSTLYDGIILPRLFNSVINESGMDYRAGILLNLPTERINLRFYLPGSGKVNCSIFDYTGQKVYEKEEIFSTPGRKALSFSTKNLMNGLYYCICQAQNNRTTFAFKIEK